MPGSALLLGGNFLFELREQCGGVCSGVLSRQLGAAVPDAPATGLRGQMPAAFDAVDREDQFLSALAIAFAAKLGPVPAKPSGLHWLLWRGGTGSCGGACTGFWFLRPDFGQLQRN